MSTVSASLTHSEYHWPLEPAVEHTSMEYRYDSPEAERTDVLASAIFPATDSFYRILIGNHIKYLSIAPGVFDMETLHSTPHLFASLPQLPPGDWTMARIRQSGGLEVSSRPLPAIRTVWHPTRFDLLTLRTVRKISDRAYEIMHPSLSGTMIAKYARFHWEIPTAEHETRIFREIEGRGIGPGFLGHIYEHGRVVGFLLRKVLGRYPERHDYAECAATLARLHKRGIKYGIMRREDFIINPEGNAVLMDFERAVFEDNLAELQMEMNLLARLF